MYGRGSQTNRPILALIFLLFLNLLMMSMNIVLKNNKSLFQTVIANVLAPVQIGFQASIDFISHEIKHYVFVKNMYRRYYDLKAQHRRLKLDNYQLRRRLEKFDNRVSGDTDPSVFIYARLISIDFSLPYNNIVINRGSMHKVSPDMVVVNEDGDLVGRTIEPISIFSSTVRLVTSSIGGVGATIEDNNLEGLISGNNNKLCSYKYILEDLPVRSGDRVITSGSDRIFPAGIPIGEVAEVQKKYLTQEILVKPYFLSKPLKKLTILRTPAPGQGDEP